MTYQIIKQERWPALMDGPYYAIWCSVSDELVAWDCTRLEVIEYFANKVYNESVYRTEYMMNKVDTMDKPYYQFTKTWDEVKLKKRRKS
jgi:hypothetical protein